MCALCPEPHEIHPTGKLLTLIEEIDKSAKGIDELGLQVRNCIEGTDVNVGMAQSLVDEGVATRMNLFTAEMHGSNFMVKYFSGQILCANNLLSSKGLEPVIKLADFVAAQKKKLIMFGVQHEAEGVKPE